MKRRSFLGLLGLAPVIPLAAKADEKNVLDTVAQAQFNRPVSAEDEEYALKILAQGPTKFRVYREEEWPTEPLASHWNSLSERSHCKSIMRFAMRPFNEGDG